MRRDTTEAKAVAVAMVVAMEAAVAMAVLAVAVMAAVPQRLVYHTITPRNE